MVHAPVATKSRSILQKQSPSSLQHLALIMDGNGRWAQERGLPRLKGHQKGAEVLKKIIEACISEQITYLTVYAFSSENWKRPATEVRHLFNLFEHYLDKEEKSIVDKNIRLKVIGDKSALPPNLRRRIERVERLSEDFKGLTLQVAFNYGSRAEILRAVRLIAKKVEQGRFKTEQITENVLSKFLYTSHAPDPDLLIRTSGEQRLSNYLLWQLAYTEFIFVSKYWPDFTADDLKEAISVYGERTRRFGRAS